VISNESANALSLWVISFEFANVMTLFDYVTRICECLELLLVLFIHNRQRVISCVYFMEQALAMQKVGEVVICLCSSNECVLKCCGLSNVLKHLS
jgi:hypothetical protein